MQSMPKLTSPMAASRAAPSPRKPSAMALSPPPPSSSVAAAFTIRTSAGRPPVGQGEWRGGDYPAINAHTGYDPVRLSTLEISSVVAPNETLKLEPFFWIAVGVAVDVNGTAAVVPVPSIVSTATV